jgi:hypothetical protein
MPAVSPIYNNMPGFGLLTINDNVQVEKFEFIFLQLQEYHRFGTYVYEKYDPAKVGGFSYNDASSVRAN